MIDGGRKERNFCVIDGNQHAAWDLQENVDGQIEGY